MSSLVNTNVQLHILANFNLNITFAPNIPVELRAFYSPTKLQTLKPIILVTLILANLQKLSKLLTNLIPVSLTIKPENSKQLLSLL